MLGFGRKPREEDAGGSGIREISTESELEAALGDGTVVLYKHSHRCGICIRSRKQMEKFSSQNPEVPVLQVDVVRDRELSNSIADRFEIRHESPQAIVVRRGEPLWNGSHSSVTADRLNEGIAPTT